MSSSAPVRSTIRFSSLVTVAGSPTTSWLVASAITVCSAVE
jgi:hypothetical protein